MLSPTLYIERVQFQFKVCQAVWFSYSQRKMAKLFANSGDPDQTPKYAASDLGLGCLQINQWGGVGGIQTKMS